MMLSTPRKHPAVSRKFATDSCGCAMGALFLGVTLVASSGWFGWRWHEYHEYSLAHAGVRILIFSLAGAVLGKLVGIAVYRLRTHSLHDMLGAITRSSSSAAQ